MQPQQASAKQCFVRADGKIDIVLFGNKTQITRRLSDGQLDECDISLREITTIRETMIHSLTAIYHARVDYPGFNPPRIPGPLPPLPRADLDSEERGVYSKASEVPISKGGEVEDEAVTQRVAKR